MWLTMHPCNWGQLPDEVVKVIAYWISITSGPRDSPTKLGQVQRRWRTIATPAMIHRWLRRHHPWIMAGTLPINECIKLLWCLPCELLLHIPVPLRIWSYSVLAEPDQVWGRCRDLRPSSVSLCDNHIIRVKALVEYLWPVDPSSSDRGSAFIYAAGSRWVFGEWAMLNVDELSVIIPESMREVWYIFYARLSIGNSDRSRTSNQWHDVVTMAVH